MCLTELTVIIPETEEIRYWQIPYTLWGTVYIQRQKLALENIHLNL